MNTLTYFRILKSMMEHEPTYSTFWKYVHKRTYVTYYYQIFAYKWLLIPILTAQDAFPISNLFLRIITYICQCLPINTNMSAIS